MSTEYELENLPVDVWLVSTEYELENLPLVDWLVSTEYKILGFPIPTCDKSIEYGFIFLDDVDKFNCGEYSVANISPCCVKFGAYLLLLLYSFAIILFAQTITQAVLHVFAYKYRGINNRKAYFYTHNNTLEFVWTIIPAIIFFVLIIYGMVTWGNIMNIEEDEDALVIELYAQQWNWKARYGGEDNVLGDANVRFLNDFDGRNSVGIDSSDPNGMDDIVVTQEFHLPVDRKVIFKFRSQDVLHSAYMPHFRAQMNCVPGMITEFSFTPTITTADMRMNSDVVDKVNRINKIRYENSKELTANGEEALEPYQFDYLLLCAKICGASHYNMQMKIVVESEKDYEKWLSQQKTFSEIIQ